MTETRNKRSVIELLSGIEIIERGKRHIVSNRLMELMPKTGLHLFLTLTGVNCCHRMSCETLKCACVRDDDDDNSRLRNTTSEIEHHLKDFNDSDDRGKHTVNSEREAISVDMKHIVEGREDSHHIH